MFGKVVSLNINACNKILDDMEPQKINFLYY